MLSYATTLQRVQRWNARSVARFAALTALASYERASGRLASDLERDRVHFLYLHHVFTDEAAGFRALLEELAHRHTFVSHSEAVERLRSGRIDGRYIAISFDDGLKTCLAASRVMDEFGARGCFFVCPSMVGNTNEEEVTRFCAERLHMPPVEFMDWRDMEDLRARGHEVGSHTVNHRQLSLLAGADLDAEVAGSRALLEQRLGPVRHFAWPFGRFHHFSPAAAEAVFRAGYASCSSAERGCHVAAAGGPASGLCIRRDHIIAGWPLAHCMYFIARSARRATPALNAWPAGWSVA